MAFDWDSWLFNQAVHYLAKHAACEQQVITVLTRKLIRKRHRKEGADGFPRYQDPLPEALEQAIQGTAKRCVDLGYIDDRAYCEMRLRTLQAKGWPLRRIKQDLGAKGVAVSMIDDILDAQGGDADFRAALAYARRRRFGPFRRDQNDHLCSRSDPSEGNKALQKHIQAMQRAGHSYSHAARIIMAEDEESLLADLEED